MLVTRVSLPTYAYTTSSRGSGAEHLCRDGGGGYTSSAVGRREGGRWAAAAAAVGGTGSALLFKVYIFGLVLGGVLLIASMMGGDHDSDAGDADFGGDADADADAGGDVDAGDDGPAHGDLGGIAALFLSLRFWSFFAAFFGLTGAVLDGFELTGSQTLTLGLSVGMGLFTGLGAAYTIRALTRGEVGTVAGASDYIGQTGRVLLPVGGEGPGKVRLELQGTTVDVLAVTDDDEPLAVGDTALVVEMRDTTAAVTRMSNSNGDS